MHSGSLSERGRVVWIAAVSCLVTETSWAKDPESQEVSVTKTNQPCLMLFTPPPLADSVPLCKWPPAVFTLQLLVESQQCKTKSPLWNTGCQRLPASLNILSALVFSCLTLSGRLCSSHNMPRCCDPRSPFVPPTHTTAVARRSGRACSTQNFRFIAGSTSSLPATTGAPPVLQERTAQAPPCMCSWSQRLTASLPALPGGLCSTFQYTRWFP